jgi:sugar-specific transcriptional regulator TrmB
MEDLAETLQLIHTLKEIGLSANEANIYLTMLNIGMNPASTIAKSMQLNRSTCYSLLNNMMTKGFVQKTIKSNITYFEPLKPHLIIGKLKNKKSELDTKISVLAKSIDHLKRINDNSGNKPSVVFFEDIAGIQNIMEDTLNSTEELRAYASLSELTQLLPNYFPSYYQRRTQKGIFVRAIYPANEDSYRHKMRDHLEFRKSRLIPPEFNFHLDILIYDNKVAIICLKEKFGLLINSEEMAQAQKKIFDLIWNGTEKYDLIMTELMAKKFGHIAHLTINYKKEDPLHQ